MLANLTYLCTLFNYCNRGHRALLLWLRFHVSAKELGEPTSRWYTTRLLLLLTDSLELDFHAVQLGFHLCDIAVGQVRLVLKIKTKSASQRR